MNDEKGKAIPLCYAGDEACGEFANRGGGERMKTFPDEPIVHCKECVWGKAVEQVGCIRFEDRGSDGLKDPDGFCAWGKKRED